MLTLERTLAIPLALLATVALIACSGDDTTPDDASQTSSGSQTSSATSGGPGGAGASGTGGGGAGTGGTAGAGGGGGSAGSGGGGGSGGSGNGCTWAKQDPCGVGMYCDAPGCAAGTCKPVPAVATETPDKDPVCGCDNATYWNSTIAGSHGMAVQGKGTCSVPLSCGGFGGIMCPANLFCNYSGADDTVCQIADGGGTCWGVPAQCPPVAIGPVTRACFSNTCTEECALIKQQVPFYPDNTCPQ